MKISRRRQRTFELWSTLRICISNGQAIVTVSKKISKAEESLVQSYEVFVSRAVHPFVTDESDPTVD